MSALTVIVTPPADWTVIVAPIATLAGGLGGYWLAGCNDERRDIRAAKREVQARRDAFAERLEQDRHTFQRDTLLQLQDELQRLVRNTARSLMQDEKTIKDHGQIHLLGGNISDEALELTVSIQRLRARVLDDQLRAAVGEFVGICSAAGVGLTEYPQGKVPDDQRQVALGQLERMSLDMTLAYDRVTQNLGTHIRRELDRRYLVADSSGGPE